MHIRRLAKEVRKFCQLPIQKLKEATLTIEKIKSDEMKMYSWRNKDVESLKEIFEKKGYDVGLKMKLNIDKIEPDVLFVGSDNLYAECDRNSAEISLRDDSKANLGIGDKNLITDVENEYRHKLNPQYLKALASISAGIVSGLALDYLLYGTLF